MVLGNISLIMVLGNISLIKDRPGGGEATLLRRFALGVARALSGHWALRRFAHPPARAKSGPEGREAASLRGSSRPKREEREEGRSLSKGGQTVVTR